MRQRLEYSVLRTPPANARKDFTEHALERAGRSWQVIRVVACRLELDSKSSLLFKDCVPGHTGCSVLWINIVVAVHAASSAVLAARFICKLVFSI